jgi:hypothetical protein
MYEKIFTITLCKFNCRENELIIHPISKDIVLNFSSSIVILEN